MPPRPKKPPRVHMTIELCPENCEQLDQIAATYHLSRTSVIAQAIVKWYRSDSAVQQKKEESNGASHP